MVRPLGNRGYVTRIWYSTMVQIPTHYVTQAEFEQLCLEHPDRIIERTAQGELVDVAPVGGEGSRWEAGLVGGLIIWSRQTKLGKVFSSQRS